MGRQRGAVHILQNEEAVRKQLKRSRKNLKLYRKNKFWEHVPFIEGRIHAMEWVLGNKEPKCPVCIREGWAS